MNPQALIKMANQIGTFFEAMPDREQAVKDVASHIERNWDPRMRTALLAQLSSENTGELKPIVIAALAGLTRQ